MGFTMNFHRNGKVIPIKMSIWDALHGVPDPKPKMPKPCTCCGKIHPKKEIIKHPKDEKRKQGDEKKDGAKEGCKINNYSTSPPVAWTDEDDKKILRMKAAGSTWAEIRDAVDKGSKSQVTARYKELQRDSGKTDEQKKEEDKEHADKKAIGERKKAENLAKNESEGKGGKNKKGRGKADQQKSDKADGKKSQGSGDMKVCADGFDRKKWIAVASKHYDKTGQRISPEMARNMAEDKS